MPSPEPLVERQSIEEVRRSELIEATVQTIARRGFDRTTVRDIARAAGASPASVLYYFSSKDELLAAAFEHTDQRFRNRVRADLEPLLGTQRLRRLVELCLPEAGESPQWDIEIDLWALAARREEFRAIFEAASVDWLSILVEAFQQGIDAGELRGVDDAREAAITFAALIDGFAVHVRVTQHVSVSDARRFLLDDIDRMRSTRPR